MNLDDMKLNWQQAAAAQPFQQEELMAMTRLRQHPVLNRIRTKLVIEAFAMVVLLFVFNDFFDGASRPLYATLVLVLGAMLYLGSNLYSFFVLQHPIAKMNIQDSLQHFLAQLYRIRTYSLVASILYSTGMFLFFTSSIVFNAQKMLLVAGILVTIAVLLYLSFRLWTNWISKVKQTVTQLQGER